METPIVFIIFNRPSVTEEVFGAIRQAQPKKLLVISDAARPEKAGEAEKCAATRAVIDRIDWDCDVRTDYAEVNLGCAKRISSGLDWAFGLVDRAIILEDDCLPHPDFFPFCEELLQKYEDDRRVTSICGFNSQFGRNRTPYSYYFSHYFHSWGWACWRRSWQNYDIELKHWAEIRDSGLLHNILMDKQAVKYWTQIFEAIHTGEMSDTWDYQCIFSFWLQNGLNIYPSENLVSNLGMGADATRTVAPPSTTPYASVSTAPLRFPLQHPPFSIRHVKADSFTQRTFFDANRQTRALWKIRRTLGLKML